MGSVAVPVGVLALLVAVGLVELVVIWSIKRHRDPRLTLEHHAPIEALTRSLAGLSLGSIVEGNAVEVIENGAFFDALVDEIGGARRTVHFETYLWKQGVLGERLSEALSERSRAGVRVRVLLDATGTKRMGKACLQRMTRAGCRVVKFHDWHLRNIGVMNERDHRKLAVIDGRVAFVGGHCVVDSWLGDAQARSISPTSACACAGPW